MTATLEAPADAPGPSDPPPPTRSAPPQLERWHQTDRLAGWLMTVGVALLAGLLRFWALGSPPGNNSIPKNGMQFDEVYYAVEAQELLRYGYEDNRGYMFIVHPPLGKWLIAASEWLVGGRDSTENLTNSLGWRIAPALIGTLAVVLVARTARRMMRSTLFGALAGVLMSLEGMSLVLSRTAILDIFLQFFVFASFAALVVDRDRMRARLAGLIADGADLTKRVPSLGPRPWRLLGGVLIGLACGVKWTGAFFLVAFVVMSWLWDQGALKSAGVRRRFVPWLWRSFTPSLASLVVAPVAAYLATWIGWFAGENSWNRHWADTHSPSTKILGIPFNWGWVPGPLRSLGDYHFNAFRFHETLDSPHPYGSKPWNWLVLGKPVSFYYDGNLSSCGSDRCSRAVLMIGTPLMWWAIPVMLLWLAWHWWTTRDWRAGAIWLAFFAGWLTWFNNLDRTMFLFYMAPLMPFLIIGLTLAVGVMVGPAIAARGGPQQVAASVARRRWGVAGASAWLGIVVVDFAWMWPLFTGGLLTYDMWHAHMWLPSWV